MTKGSGAARKQPLNFVITTAGSDKNSICYEVHSKALDILEGRKHDSTFYPVVYSTPTDADWTDPKVWKAVNPSLGKTVDAAAVDQDRARGEKALRRLSRHGRHSPKGRRRGVWKSSRIRPWRPTPGSAASLRPPGVRREGRRSL